MSKKWIVTTIIVMVVLLFAGMTEAEAASPLLSPQILGMVDIIINRIGMSQIITGTAIIMEVAKHITIVLTAIVTPING